MPTADLAARLLAFTRVLTDEETTMSAEELLCFLTVAVRPGISVGELAQETSLPQSTVSRYLRRLCSRPHRSKGELGPIQWDLEIGTGTDPLIEQRVHPENAKQKALYVTGHGDALLDRFERAMNGAS